MKGFVTVVMVVAAIVLAGACGKKTVVPVAPQADAVPLPAATPLAEPVSQSAMTDMEQGDTSAAVLDFVNADWSARPLFAPDSLLNLSEAQYATLPAEERERKSGAVNDQMLLLRKLVEAVAQSGRDAAANGNAEQAKKCFTALQQCGAALDSPDRLQVLRLMGQAFKKLASDESAKLGK